ncbi:hypothetical protein [Nocardia sp. NPDC023988]|uniref:hypothetical protein n=1 Tax=unclassified Nocardia TaxID=2637762 RepID=UPI0033C9B96D
MAALGICVVPGAGAPKLDGVVVAGTFECPTLITHFTVRTNTSEASEQAIELARLLLAKLPALDFTSAAVRVAGPSPVGNRRKAAFSRAHAEGAAMFVLREHLGASIVIGDPKSLAKCLAIPVKELEDKATALLRGKCDAALAALSQLTKA